MSAGAEAGPALPGVNVGAIGPGDRVLVRGKRGRAYVGHILTGNAHTGLWLVAVQRNPARRARTVAVDSARLLSYAGPTLSLCNH